MTKPRFGGRGSLDTWLRQKYAKIKPHRRRGAPIVGYQRAIHHSPRQQTAKVGQLAAFRLWMWDAGMLASKTPEYRRQIAEACIQFDKYLADNSHVAKGRRRGSNFTVGSAAKKVEKKNDRNGASAI